MAIPTPSRRTPPPPPAPQPPPLTEPPCLLPVSVSVQPSLSKASQEPRPFANSRSKIKNQKFLAVDTLRSRHHPVAGHGRRNRPDYFKRARHRPLFQARAARAPDRAVSSSRDNSPTSGVAAERRPAPPAVQHLSGPGRHHFPFSTKPSAKAPGSLSRMQPGEETERHRAARPRFHVPKAGGDDSPARRRRLWHGGDVSVGATLTPKRHRLRRRPAERGYPVRKGIPRARLGGARHNRRRQSRRKRAGDTAIAGRIAPSSPDEPRAERFSPAARRRCCARLAGSRSNSTCRRSFPWTSTCAAASEPASRASFGSGRTAAGSTRGPALKGRCLMPGSFTGRRTDERQIRAKGEHPTSNIQHPTSIVASDRGCYRLSAGWELEGCMFRLLCAYFCGCTHELVRPNRQTDDAKPGHGGLGHVSVTAWNTRGCST